MEQVLEAFNQYFESGHWCGGSDKISIYQVADSEEVQIYSYEGKNLYGKIIVTNGKVEVKPL